MTKPLRDAGVPSAVTDKVDQVLRPVVDAGYSSYDPDAGPYIEHGRLKPAPTKASTTKATTKPSRLRPGLFEPSDRDPVRNFNSQRRSPHPKPAFGMPIKRRPFDLARPRNSVADDQRAGGAQLGGPSGYPSARPASTGEDGGA